jgi:hypothetical protein
MPNLGNMLFGEIVRSHPEWREGLSMEEEWALYDEVCPS